MADPTRLTDSVADELTLILNHAAESLALVGPHHPASAGLRQLLDAALRCAAITRALVRNCQPSAISHRLELEKKN